MSDFIIQPENFVMSSYGSELQEVRKVVIAMTIVAIRSNPDVARKMGDRERKQLRAAIANATLDQLHKRIEAVSIQNPGCLAEALKLCGYKITVDADGGVVIDPGVDESKFSAQGDLVDYDAWLKADGETV